MQPSPAPKMGFAVGPKPNIVTKIVAFASADGLSLTSYVECASVEWRLVEAVLVDCFLNELPMPVANHPKVSKVEKGCCNNSTRKPAHRKQCKYDRYIEALA
jgi:hypothetical protein